MEAASSSVDSRSGGGVLEGRVGVDSHSGGGVADGRGGVASRTGADDGSAGGVAALD